MRAVRAEFLKLKRSLSWAVVVLLPAMAVITGTVNFVFNRGQLQAGWASLWSQAVLFYGMFYLSIGVAALASLVWRVEHRGHNWNALMGGPTTTTQVVVAKLAALTLLVAAMQVVLVAGVFIGGKVAGLPGAVPAQYVLVAALGVLLAVPVAALQSGLSMLLRSFAAPVALALLGTALSFGALLGGFRRLSLLSPYTLLQQGMQLGSTAVSDAGRLTLTDFVTLLGPAALVTAVLVVLTVAALNRLDVRS